MSGCSKKDGRGNGDGTPSVTAEFAFLEENSNDAGENGGEDESGAKRVAWNDNKLDDYHAVINHVVEKVEAEGENHLGSVPLSLRAAASATGNTILVITESAGTA